MTRHFILAALAAGGLALVGCGGDSASAPETGSPVASIELTYPTNTVAVGHTLALTAVARSSSGVPLPGRTITFTSNPSTVATVSTTGIVTGVAAGTATVTATSEGKSAQRTVVVEAVTVPVATITVNRTLDTLEAWDVLEHVATVKDAAGNVLTGRTVRWTSSDPLVGVIDSVTGRLTGVDRGTVTVTATSEGKTGVATRVVVIKYRSLTAGSSHACDIASGGIVWCWGLNGNEGRTGNPQLGANAYAGPTQVNTTLRFRQVSTYGTTTCAVTKDSKGYCWGSNAGNMLGDGSNVTQRTTPGLVSGNLLFRMISVGSAHACGLTIAGEAYCWGTNSDGQLGTGNKTWASTPVAVSGNQTFANITAGTDFTCGVTSENVGYCWGYSGMGNLADGAPPSMGNTNILNPNPIAGRPVFLSISATNQLACGVTMTGTGLCWGRADQRLGVDATIPSSMPLAVSGAHFFRSISAGATSACGIRQDDAVLCWGLNANGQLGQNIANGSAQPVRVTGLLTAAEVSTANFGGGTGAFACAISVDRMTTKCWGKNDVMQLGNGGTTPATGVNSTPSIVQGQRPNP